MLKVLFGLFWIFDSLAAFGLYNVLSQLGTRKGDPNIILEMAMSGSALAVAIYFHIAIAHELYRRRKLKRAS